MESIRTSLKTPGAFHVMKALCFPFLTLTFPLSVISESHACRRSKRKGDERRLERKQEKQI